MSLRHRLFAAFLLIGLFSTLVTGYLGYTSAKRSLEEAIYHHLKSLREAKAQEIQNYFRSLNTDVMLKGLSPVVITATRQFRDAVRQMDNLKEDPAAVASVTQYYQKNYLPQLRDWLGTEPNLADFLPIGPVPVALQKRFIVDNPHPVGEKDLLDSSGVNDAYDVAHKTWNPYFRRYVEATGFYDLVLVDPISGLETYTEKKEPDFGTNLNVGPYRATSQARVAAICAESNQPGYTSFKDFTADPGAQGAPAAFIATPVYEQSALVGVLAMQVSNKEIDRIMTDNCNWERNGLGTTGETYLVGPDRLMRSSSRFFLQDRESYYKMLVKGGYSADITAIKRNNTPVLQQEVNGKAVNAALSGVEGTEIIPDYRGVSALTSYQPVNILGVTWVLEAKIDEAEAFAPIIALRNQLLLVSAMILLGALSLSGWLVSQLMRPIQALTDGAQRMSHGDHSVRVPVESGNELGLLSQAFNEMAESIEEKSSQIVQKNKENEALLLNILPGPIADRLRGGEQRIADQFAEVSVLFADIVGFTALAGTIPTHEAVEFLNGLFTKFDATAQHLGIEKIKTIGDAYMAVCGLPTANKNHAQRMVQMAVSMIHISREYGRDRGLKLQLRIGVNSGPVVAGVIGQNKFIYDLWGDTVNLASRMESLGVPDSVQVTRAVYDSLKDQFPFKSRGEIDVRGKGIIETWTLDC